MMHSYKSTLHTVIFIVGHKLHIKEVFDYMNKETFSFVVYMIHACANKWRKFPSDVYKILQKSGCIDNYLVPHYAVLHTQGTDYVVEDIKEYLRVRGVFI